MGFQSIDEIENFSFDDCELVDMKLEADRVVLTLESLIVEPSNSQNGNFTESYAGTTQVRLSHGRILGIIKEGHKYYDADEVLINEVPDEKVLISDFFAMLKSHDAAYLYNMEKNANPSEICKNGSGEELQNYLLEIELPEEDSDDMAANTFQIEICFSKAIFNWEFYMNRVQR